LSADAFVQFQQQSGEKPMRKREFIDSRDEMERMGFSPDCCWN
jgi:hypothetical protein